MSKRKKELIDCGNISMEYDLDIVSLNKKYKVSDMKCDMRRLGNDVKILKLISINKYYLIMINDKGIKYCYPNHQGLTKLIEIPGR